MIKAVIKFRFLALLALLASGLAINSQAQTVTQTIIETTEAPQLEPLLTQGTTHAINTIGDYVATHPADSNARLSLGLAHFLRSVEVLAQSWYEYGLKTDGIAAELPFFRLPIPKNPNPKPVTNRDLRLALDKMLKHLAEVDAVLAPLDEPATPVKLVLNLQELAFDIDGDGTTGQEGEYLWDAYEAITGTPLPDVPVALDQGDVHWLRGYSHLLSGLLELWLATDTQNIFDHTAQLFFTNPKTPYQDLYLDETVLLEDYIESEWVDVFAFVYLLLDLEIIEPDRLELVITHFDEVMNQSEASWAAILAETDNDREWIPNPNQESVIPVDVDEEIITGWQDFITEATSILKGETLLPHWRLTPTTEKGINLRKLLLETDESFDIVLFLQGPDTAPYLESGEITSPETWERINNLLQGNFIGFAVWFN